MALESAAFCRLGAVVISCGCLILASSAHAADPPALAVSEFDYADTSGEATDQSEAHAARLQNFARLVRDELSASGKYRIVPIACPNPRCSAGAMDPQSLTDAARQSGARLLLYGGVHKMSTLIQFGKAQIVDLKTDKVVFDRMISFRGDNDEAWQRAGEFLAEDLLSKGPSVEP
jgi:Protein of unknown function (DUF2380)